MLTTEGVSFTRAFFNMTVARVDACSATAFCSGVFKSLEVAIADAYNVSITLARMSASGKSSPRMSKGSSYGNE